MLEIRIATETYSLEKYSTALDASFSLDSDWKDGDYKNGGSALGLIFSGNYLFQKSEVKKAQNIGIMMGEIDEFFTVSLEINHTDYDMETQKCIALGNIPFFFSLQDLDNLSITEEICKNSTLDFGNIIDSQISSIIFKDVKNTTLCCEVGGTFLYCIGEKEISGTFFLQEYDVPFLIEARMEGGETEAERVTSISQCKECLESIYPKEQYHYDIQDIQEEAFGIKICIL